MDNENRKEDKRGIFLGIVGVLTLIVAIIGASFAYFSLNARSNENAVKVQAATVQIVYEEGQNIAIENIIPSTQDVALETVRRAGETRTGTGEKYVACIDDNNYRVCGTYDFTLTNNGTVKKYPVPIVIENSYNYDVKSIPVLVKYDNDWVELDIIKEKVPSKICVSTNYEWCDERQDIEDKYPNFVKYVKDKNTIWY